MVDAEQIKEGILYALRTKGPSLPVQLATEVKSTILFTSAFLSELVSEKKIKMSIMRVGSSPIYFLQGQEARLESFSPHLRSKEREAFALLKEKSFLLDATQQPAIRVALREIKDFALPFKSQEDVVWRYFLVPESEYNPKELVKEEEPVEIKVKEKEKEVIEEKPVEVLAKPKERKKTVKRKAQEKGKFFDKIKEFLSAKTIELKDVEGFTKNEIILRVLDKGEEKIFIAYNKRKISDNDIIKAHKKVSGRGLPYVLLSFENPSKKTSDLIKAMRSLSSIDGMK